MGIVKFISPVKRNEKSELKLSLRQEISWLWNPAVIGYYMLMIITGIAIGAIDSFKFVFFSEDLHASMTLIGQATSLGLVSDITQAFLIGYFQHKIGNIHLVLIAKVANGIKMFLWTIIWSDPPYEILGYAVLSTYSIMWIGNVGYVSEVAPMNLIGTALGMSSTCLWVVGKGIGTVLSGLIAERVGLRNMFRVFSAVSIGSAVVYFILHHTCLKFTEE